MAEISPREIKLPYFKRRPYTETKAPRPTGSDSKGISFLKAARDILALEMGEPVGPFRLRGLLQPGGDAIMVLDLALDNAGPPLGVSLMASDLVGPVSNISANSVRISPSNFTLFPDASAEVEVTVSAPPDARPGLYTGTLSVSGDEVFIVVIEAEVGKNRV